MNIEGTEFTLGATWGPLEVADSFVVRENKVGAGAGEAKLYVGPRQESSLRVHFGSKYFSASCIMLRDEVLSFLNAVRSEYDNPSQNYSHPDKLSANWLDRYSLASKLPQVISFDVTEQKAGGSRRCYVKGSGHFELLRELPLPRLAQITFTKLTDSHGKEIQLVRLHQILNAQTTLDREDAELVLVRLLQDDQELDDLTRDQLIKARVGQGVYRKNLLTSCGATCPMTGIDDENLLVASHIKPWRDANNGERLDSQNGFILSPLWDKLFDSGLISFDDQGHLLVSKNLDNRIIRMIGLVPGSLYRKLPVGGDENVGRRTYLAYHRDSVFLG
jgi:putative restriction endonuclease